MCRQQLCAIRHKNGIPIHRVPFTGKNNAKETAVVVIFYAKKFAYYSLVFVGTELVVSAPSSILMLSNQFYKLSSICTLRWLFYFRLVSVTSNIAATKFYITYGT